MKKMNLKSLMFALVALFAASAALVFTSCGDDKDEPDSQSVIGQWEVTNVEEIYGSEDSRVAWEFKADGTYYVYYYNKDKWWVWFGANYKTNPIDANTGKGTMYYWYDGEEEAPGTSTYWFEGGQLRILDIGKTTKLKRTSGIKAEFPS